MAYLYTAKITTIFETTKFVAHNFLFNVSAIIALQKKIRDLRDFKDFKDLRAFKDFSDGGDRREWLRCSMGAYRDAWVDKRLEDTLWLG